METTLVFFVNIVMVYDIILGCE